MQDSQQQVSHFDKWLQKIPLAWKMLILTASVGLVAWAVLDAVQARTVRSLFHGELKERFSQQATEDRIRFDQYVKNYNKAVKVITSQKKFLDYLGTVKWSDDNIFNVKHHRRTPSWLPKTSVMRSLVSIRHALLYDADNVLREIYQTRREPLPEELAEPSSHLFELANKQSFISLIEGVPHVITSETVYDKTNTKIASLVLASPMDDEFLIATQGLSNNGNIIALLGTNKPAILVSSDSHALPSGTYIDSIKNDYLVAGEAYFDYGASALPIRFTSFKSTKEVENLTSAILSGDRMQRVYAAIVFIASFMLVMLYITRRVQMLGIHITDYARQTLKAQPQKFIGGDQIYILEQRFHNLITEVAKARETMRRDASEKILLVRKNIQEKDKQLQILQSVTETLGVGVITYEDGKIKTTNKQMEEFSEQCAGLEVFDIFEKACNELVLNDVKGNVRVFYVTKFNLGDDKQIISLVQEVTELKAKTEALEHQAMHDSLTGLPNRSLMNERLAHAIPNAQRERKPIALLMMDLDRFKEINDTLGHHFGDLLLKEVAKRLQVVLRDSDTVARFGGDEFAVLLSVPDEGHAVMVANKIIEAIDREFTIENHIISTEISIGIAMFPNHGDNGNTLLQRADVAMYVAKQTHSGFAFYDQEQDPHSLNRLALMGELRQAIESDQMLLHYQPKIDMKTGRVTATEALIRWKHPREGFVPPDMFIPIAEQTGLIKPLTHWVLNEAIRQCARWRRDGYPINMAVNLSARNLQDNHLPVFVRNLLDSWGMRPEWLVLEITESAIMSNPLAAKETLQALDEMGISLSIDDFGTGHSSLAYIKQLPVDEIKIDKSFVTEMTEDENDAVIVRATIDLAHNLGLKVTAEGVEDKESYDTLEILGCDQVQGYYMSRALEPDKLKKWMNDSPYGFGNEIRRQQIKRIK